MRFKVIDYIGEDPRGNKNRTLVLYGYFSGPRCIVEERQSEKYNINYRATINSYVFRKTKKRQEKAIGIHIVYHLGNWKKVTKRFILHNLLNGKAFVLVGDVRVPEYDWLGSSYKPAFWMKESYEYYIDIDSSAFEKKKDCFLRRLLKEKEEDFEE